MIEQLIPIVLVLVIGWLLIIAPAEYILPWLISKKISKKNIELHKLFEKIPFFGFDRRYDMVEKLLKSEENSEYMKNNFFFTHFFYLWSKKIFIVVISLFFIATVVSQILGIFEFVSDPKEKIKKVQESVEKLNSN